MRDVFLRFEERLEIVFDPEDQQTEQALHGTNDPTLKEVHIPFSPIIGGCSCKTFRFTYSFANGVILGDIKQILTLTPIVV